MAMAQARAPWLHQFRRTYIFLGHLHRAQGLEGGLHDTVDWERRQTGPPVHAYWAVGQGASGLVGEDADELLGEELKHGLVAFSECTEL